MKALTFIFVTVLLSFQVSNASVIMTEIMYDPVQDDNYNEWIEIYNPTDESISLEGWKLCNNQILAGYVDRNGQIVFNDTFLIPSNGYGIITDGGTGTEVYVNFKVSGTALHVDASSLCGGLSNSGKSLQLYNGSQLVEKITYSNSLGANNDGNSLQKVNNNWIPCIPTLGLPNCVGSQTTTPTTTTLSDQTTTTILSTPVNTPTNQQNTCDLSLVVSTDQIIYNADTALEYKIIVEDVNCQNFNHNFKIEHWIEDLYGNITKESKTSEDDLICKKTKTFQWTPKNLIGSEGYLIKAKITDVGCVDLNSTNNENSNLIVVKGNQTETTSSTAITTPLIVTTTQKTSDNIQKSTTTNQKSSTTIKIEPKKITGKTVGFFGKIYDFFKSLFSWFRR